MSHEEQRLRPLSLAFASDTLEQDFQAQYLPRLRLQARIAMLLGAVQYLSFGLFDPTYLPEESHLGGIVWTIRLLALVPGFVILALTWRRSFDRHPHSLVCLSGVFAGLGMLATLAVLPQAAVPHYYPAIAVMMAWIYNLSGVRFPYACVTGLFVTIGYNVVFLVLRDDLPLSKLLLHDFIIVSANCIGMISAYLVEWQRRRLFVNERLLDRQRRASLQQALHDPLTGLPNRTLLDDRLQQAIIQSERGRYRSAGLYIDLDGFKPLNDTHGHEAGDQVLREVASRLRDAMREADTVARIGGDEFFVVAPQTGSTESAMALAGKLQMIVQTPMWLSEGNQMVSVGASIGICLFPFPGATPELVLQRSDRSMYAAKRDGRGRAVLSSA
jgi:diguanylate cyclase (GGDEF)-like protein